MPWRTSPFFERQFAAITRRREPSAEREFVADILNSTNDDSLLVFADWLEERGDARAQYIRDMCDLASGQRPLDALVDRVNAFEDSHETGAPLYAHMTNDCYLCSLERGNFLFEDDFETLSRHLLNPPLDIANIRLVILDVQRVRFMHGHFLGVLIRAHRTIRDGGADLRLCRLDAPVLEVFKVTKLDRLISIYDTVDEAVS